MNAAKKNKHIQGESLIGASSLLKSELELNGRRLVIMKAVARTKVAETVATNKEIASGNVEDRRNLYLKKEGLLNEKEWIH